MKTTFVIAVVALVMAAPAAAQTMYRCHDLGKTIYSDRPCLNGEEVKQLAPNGNPTDEHVSRMIRKARADEQRALKAALPAKPDAASTKPDAASTKPDPASTKPAK